MIAVYCVVILLFVGVAVTLFVTKLQKDKKRYKKLHEERKEEKVSKLNEESVGHEIQKTTAEKQEEFISDAGSMSHEQSEGVEECKQEIPAEFENFSLDNEVEEKIETPKRRRFNPFDMDEDEEDSEDNKDIDDKFAEYERFLRENLDLDDDDDKSEETDEQENETTESDSDSDDYEEFLRKNLSLDDDKDDEDELRALRNFDYNSIKGKSESEIRQIIKNLPPKAQEILLSDILARKNWDEEN